MGVIVLVLGCAGDVCTHGCDDEREVDTTDTGDTGEPDSGDSGDTGPPLPTDADSDGVFTPDDCDDADADIHPGATDWCDGVVQDCDGDPVGAGMCGEWGTLDDLKTLYWVGEEPDQRFSGGWFSTIDDQEMMHARILDTIEGDFAQTLFVGIPDPSHRWSPGAVGLWKGRFGVNEVNTLVPAGDFNGDGWDDLWVWTGDRGYPRGDFRLQLGPSADWPAEGIYGDEVEDGVWYETEEDNDILSSAGPGRDIDGDGLADMVHGARHGVTFMFGRADVAGNHDLLGEPWVREDDMLYPQNHAMIGPDMDGDGMREVTLGGGDTFNWLSGSDLRLMSGSDLSGAMNTLPRMEDLVDANEPWPLDMGDLDQDGVDDLMVRLYAGVEDEPACLAWLSSAEIPTATWVEESILAQTCWYGDAEESDAYAGYGDIDGDGVLDPRFVVYDREVYYDTGWSSLGCPFGTDRLELGGTIDASEISPCYNGLASSIPDVTGDGRADFGGSNIEWLDADTEDYGRSDILPGFDIPWDDLSKW